MVLWRWFRSNRHLDDWLIHQGDGGSLDAPGWLSPMQVAHAGELDNAPDLSRRRRAKVGRPKGDYGP
jgi:hypothetical protein